MRTKLNSGGATENKGTYGLGHVTKPKLRKVVGSLKHSLGTCKNRVRSVVGFIVSPKDMVKP